MVAQAFIWTLMPVAALQADSTATPSPLGWEEAVRLADTHRTEWMEVWRTLDADAAVCEAIVFPELLRYGHWQDNVELAALFALYVQYGKEAANYSIGLFQMKPSFAEEVETAWMGCSLRHTYRLYFDLRNGKEQRSKRIQRLRDERWQCVYLAIFVRLLLEREPAWKELSPEARLRLLATAYNYSFTTTTEQLKNRQGEKSFHLGLFRTESTPYYSYAELAVKRYRSLQPTKKEHK